MNRNPKMGTLEPFDFEHLLVNVPELKQFDTQIETYQFNRLQRHVATAMDRPVACHCRPL